MTAILISNSAKNNLGLIRLIAAFQVAVCHILGVYEISNWFVTLLNMFPGVPIFFFISGLLIAHSFENSKSNNEFYIKRLKRIFPALYGQVVISILFLLLSGYLLNIQTNLKGIFIFIFTQFTIFQFYTPDFLKNYGVGSFNGIVWSIFVELQIYAIFPYLSKLKLQYLIVISIISYVVDLYCINSKNYELIKYLNVTFLPWIIYFNIGLILYKYKNRIHIIKDGTLIMIFPMYLIFYYYFSKNGFGSGNYINPVCLFILIKIIIKISFGKNTVPMNCDLSYGIYLYHMTFLNFILYKYQLDWQISFLLVLSLTLVFSYLSYRFIESPIHKIWAMK